MTFSEYIAREVGSSAWIAANHLTLAMQRRGYDKAVPWKKMARLKEAFELHRQLIGLP